MVGRAQQSRRAGSGGRTPSPGAHLPSISPHGIVLGPRRGSAHLGAFPALLQLPAALRPSCLPGCPQSRAPGPLSVPVGPCQEGLWFLLCVMAWGGAVV